MSRSMNPYGTFPRRKASRSNTMPYFNYVPADVEETPAWAQFQPTSFPPRGGYAPAYDAWGYANARMWSSPFQELQQQPKIQGYHPFLAQNSGIIFDVRHMEAYDVEFRRLFDSSLSSVQAFEPSIKKIRLIAKDLPWSIQVRNDKGVTVRDILFAIFTELQQPLTESEYWLATDDDRERMIKAYNEAQQPKVGRPPRNKDEGVKRVDYLGTKTEFAGIRPVGGNLKDESFAEKRLAVTDNKSLEGVWVVKFREAQDD